VVAIAAEMGPDRRLNTVNRPSSSIGFAPARRHVVPGQNSEYILRGIFVTCQKRQLSRRRKLLLLTTDGRSTDLLSHRRAFHGEARLPPDATTQYAERLQAKGEL
jgi:hypothetical protein